MKHSPMFEALSSWLEQASEAVGSLTEQGAEMAQQTGLLDFVGSRDATNVEGAPGEVEPTDTSGVRQLTLSAVKSSPGGWTAAAEEWELLVHAALCDRTFCSVSPAATVDDGETWKEICALLKLRDAEVKRAEEAAAGVRLYEPQASIAEWLPTEKPVYSVYAFLVPRVVDDEDYWHIVGWKLELCAKCSDSAVLLQLVKRLSEKVRRQVGREEDKGEGAAPALLQRTVNEEHWDKAESDLRSLQAKLQWRGALEAEATKEIGLASGNLKLLQGLVSKQDMRSDLAQSVAESCSYHKLKITKLLGEAEREKDRLAGSSLSAEGPGALYASLLHTNKSLQQTMQLFEERRLGARALSNSSESSFSLMRSEASRDMAVVSVSTSKDNANAGRSSIVPPPATSPESPPTTAASRMADTPEDFIFEAKMPWGDDEDF